MKESNLSPTTANLRHLFLALLIATGATSLAACDLNEGPAEEAGEEIDEAAEDAEEQIDDNS